jgi:signal peptidase I
MARRTRAGPFAPAGARDLMTRDLRSGLLTAALVGLVALAWALAAPRAIGGPVTYVATQGTSMQPRFETGDLALVRAGSEYRVGDVVAYRSSALDTVVLHRIIGRDGDRYVFKGDNNDFIDPTHPRRDELIGSLWLRIPQGGQVLAWLDRPIVSAALAGGLALLLLGSSERRRRRRRGAEPHRPMTPRHHTFLIASLVTAAAFLALGLAAFARPATDRVAVKTAYTERAGFSYSAPVGAAAAPVYPGGMVKPGDPIFLRLVPRLRVSLAYTVATTAPHELSGTRDVVVRVSSAAGWSRTIRLAPEKPFTGDRAVAYVTLDVAALRKLTARMEALTGTPPGSGYTVEVSPRVHLNGTLAGQPVKSSYRPALSFQLDSLQLRPTGKLEASRAGQVTGSASVASTLSLRGRELPVATARAIALAGLLLSGLAALVAWRSGRRLAGDPAAHIHGRYGHLIVPIAGIATTPRRPPIDVTSIEALAQLAERSERLILHHRADGADTYLVDDEGTLYRYRSWDPERRVSAAPEMPAGTAARRAAP